MNSAIWKKKQILPGYISQIVTMASLCASFLCLQECSVHELVHNSPDFFCVYKHLYRVFLFNDNFLYILFAT